jgi:asparagine synthase (glutamine-hydrolysing)
MCGIAGYVSIDKGTDVSCIQSMTDAIKHRGPDGFGHKIFDNIAIGHRRLSIIDIEAGKQPMCSDDEKIWITFNGEIYNYKDVREELLAFGYQFKTNSDTEVIIYAYHKWGVDCLQKLRGMFAFGIVDLNTKKIFLARDHFGIKPLYVFKSKHNIAFGSELQQFKKLPHFDKSINTVALDNYLCLQYIPAPLTIFNSVQKLNAAHYMTITFEGIVSEQIPYWDINYSKKSIRSQAEWLEATESAIKDSVKAHLVSDVPFGAFLSGGIDSTLIVKYMSETLKEPIKTFSIGFEEKEFNELEYSNLASKIYNTEHYIEVVKPDALNLLPKLVKHYGEPFGDSSAIPTYYVCELARKHVTVSLSGDGGDECFAGYGSYINWMQGSKDNYYEGIKKKLYPYANYLLPNKYSIHNELPDWLKQIEFLNSEVRTQLWRNDYKTSVKKNPSTFVNLFNHTKSYSHANKAQYMDAKTYMNFDILSKVDGASMCHSLEVRTPFIDKNVWEFATTIPEDFNISNKSGKWQGKLLLKQLLMKDFSEDFIYRKKQGFAIPLSKWFLNDNQLIQHVNDKLLSSTSLLNEYFEPEKIKEFVNANNSGVLWLLLYLEEWLRQFHSTNAD